MGSRRLGRFVSAALALTLLLGTLPAFAGGGDPVVTAGVTVAGVPLVGMTAAQAHRAIAAACSTPTLAPLAVDASGIAFSMQVETAVALDIDGMVADALAAAETTDMAPRWTADGTAISSFVATVAKAIARKAVNAKRTIVNHRLKVVAQVNGRALDTAAALQAVSGAVTAEIGAGGSTQATVTVPVLVIRAKTTTANIGKTILVVLHERKVYLYKNTKLEKSYRCAIGMSAHPTPKGLFKVIAKSAHPAWHNPGSAWAKGMPSYIKPGYYNPLGLRALYLNASGIRIHGTAKTWSMGHAASHGCIRLTNHNVLDIYPRVPVGTPVYILS
ncbi:MAG TPA: L,D-transpeptidase family protein [Coriobacteriia bacterium]